MDFRYRLGGHTFNSVLFDKVENIGTSELIYNQDKRALYDRWQKPGDKAQFKDSRTLLLHRCHHVLSRKTTRSRWNHCVLAMNSTPTSLGVSDLVLFA